ncbi:MAG: DUF484 family protein, partial [Pseudomonadales bacterium]
MSSAKNYPASESASACGDTISDQQVIDHLEQRPDFFRYHPEAIAKLELPHQTGSAISLVERQVAVLRDRSVQTRRKLRELIDIAKDNDQLIESTQQLVIALLKADCINVLCTATTSQFSSRFGVEFTAVLFLCNSTSPLRDQVDASVQREFSEAETVIGKLLDPRQTLCGALREKEAAFVFGAAAKVGSAAIATRQIDSDTRLLLAVANAESSHYGSQTGTLFIDHIA